MHVLNSLVPVFLIILLGKLLCRTGFLSDGTAKSLNKLTYWVALPALLLDKISTSTFNAEEVSRISLLLVIATLASAAISWLIARLLKLERRAIGAFIQCSARSNNAFVGLPVILYALTDLYPGVETAATLSLAPAIVCYNVMSISVLLAFSDQKTAGTGTAVRLFTKQLLTNPLLLACVVGLAINALQIRFPMILQRSLSTLGSAALALALLSIGSSLSFEGIGQNLNRSFAASSIKVFIQPLLGLGLAVLWGLPAMDRQILLLYLACPTAVASYVLTDIFNSDRDLAAHIIVLSTLLSAVSLSLIIAFGG